MPARRGSTFAPDSATAGPRFFAHLITALLFSIALLIWGSSGALAQSKVLEAHSQIFRLQASGTGPQVQTAMTVYEGSRTCARCHEYAAAEVAGSLHYQLKAPALNVPGYETNLLGMANEYCGLPGTVSSINWIGILKPANTNYPSQPAGCARCHVGTGPKPQPVDQLTQADYDNVDCLICHAPGYSRTVVSTNGQFALVPSSNVNMVVAIQNVQRPTSEMCLRCHLSSGGGPNFKHGVVPSKATDVHLAAAMECVDCHVSSRHHIAGPGDLKAVDLAGVEVSCAKCHTAAPHKGENAFYNTHVDRIACQTCHITAIARPGSPPTLVERDWTQPVLNSATGLYDPINVMGTNLAPLYRWWNGKVQKYPPGPLGDIADPDAKISPWKHVRSYVPADAADTSRLLPLKIGVYSVQGNVNQAVAVGTQESGTSYSGAWTRVADDLYFALQHQVAPKSEALRCDDCHTPVGGRLDFAALGYGSNQVAYLQSTAPWQGASHVGRFGNGYAGPETCVQCHLGKTEEVMDSIHYTLRTPNPKIAEPGGGSHGMLDRLSGLAGASTMINYYAQLDGFKEATGCGKCHIGKTLPLPNYYTGKYTQAQKDELDCLICHAAEGAYDMNGDGALTSQDAEATARVLVPDAATGGFAWFQDRSARAAETVGGRVSVAACLRCHDHLQGAPDYKRGTSYTPEYDVHASAGMLCTRCHTVSEHKIARGSRVSDMHGWELQDVEVDCVNCHSRRPHPEWPTNPAFVPYNEHAVYISCQACHIPWISGVSRRIWTATEGVTEGPEALVPARDPLTGLYLPYSEYTAAYRTRPVYRWFNGEASMMAEPLHDVNAWDGRVATRATPGAMVYPFRPLVNGMVLDRRGRTGDSSYNPQYTLAGSLTTKQDYLQRMGFMREEGLNELEKAALAQMPNMLDFDYETYTRTGDVAGAVDTGMGRWSMLVTGRNPYFMSPGALGAAGSNLWSGDLLGLNLPNNSNDPKYDPAAGPSKVTGSFISVNHAVDRVGALKCMDCHSQSGVMDFEALSYTPEQAARLATMFDQVQFIQTTRTSAGLKLRWSTIPGRSYQLLMSPDLATGPWTPVNAPKRTISRWLEHTVPSSTLSASGHLFFRVQEF